MRKKYVQTVRVGTVLMVRSAIWLMGLMRTGTRISFLLVH